MRNIVLLVFLFLLISSASAKEYEETYYYQFQKHDNPSIVAQKNYGYVTNGILKEFLVENKITNPLKIKIGFKAVMHKSLIDTRKLSDLLEHKIENKYKKKIESVESSNAVLGNKLATSNENLKIASQNIAESEQKNKSLNSILYLVIIISLIIVILVVMFAHGLLKDTKFNFEEAKKAQSEIEILTKRLQREHEANLVLDSNHTEEIKRKQEEKVLLANRIRELAEETKNHKENSEKNRKDLEILKIFRRKKPGNLDIVKIGKEYYPRIVIAWELSYVIDMSRKFLKPMDICFSELRMACGKCKEIIGNCHLLVNHWDEKHSFAERKSLTAEIMKPGEYDEMYYISDYTPMSLE